MREVHPKFVQSIYIHSYINKTNGRRSALYFLLFGWDPDPGVGQDPGQDTGPGPGPGCGPGSETRDLGTGNGSGPKALNQDPENQTESRRTRVSDPRRDLILVLFIVCRFLFLLLICVQSLKKYQTWSPK